MEVRLRTTRTLKVTEVKLGEQDLAALADLYRDPRYQVLLNLMEAACIELETGHFNTAAGDPETILGGHLMCKASWLFFTYVQKQVRNAYLVRTGDQEEGAHEEPSLNDILQGVEGIPPNTRWD